MIQFMFWKVYSGCYLESRGKAAGIIQVRDGGSLVQCGTVDGSENYFGLGVEESEPLPGELWSGPQDWTRRWTGCGGIRALTWGVVVGVGKSQCLPCSSFWAPFFLPINLSPFFRLLSQLVKTRPSCVMSLNTLGSRWPPSWVTQWLYSMEHRGFSEVLTLGIRKWNERGQRSSPLSHSIRGAPLSSVLCIRFLLSFSLKTWIMSLEKLKITS